MKMKLKSIISCKIKTVEWQTFAIGRLETQWSGAQRTNYWLKNLLEFFAKVVYDIALQRALSV